MEPVGDEAELLPQDHNCGGVRSSQSSTLARHGHQHLTAGCSGQPLGGEIVVPEPGDRQRRRQVVGQGHRAEVTALLFQDPGQFEDAEPGAVVRLGDGQAQQAGLTEGLPELGVVPIGKLVDFAQPRWGGPASEDGGREIGGVGELRGGSEVHFSSSSLAAGPGPHSR